MRYQKLDIARAVAVVWMVVFHCNYFLVEIFDIQTWHFSNIFWYIQWKASALLFMFIAGISFLLAKKKYPETIVWKYLKISLALAVIAGCISLTSYVFIPEQYIRFGIIHFFALSFVLLLVCRRLKYYNILLWAIIMAYGAYFIPVIENEHLYFLWFMYDGFKSADYYPIVPYFGVMLWWYALALFLSDHNKLSILKRRSADNMFYSGLEYIGRHSLIIYLLHPPLLIWMIYLVV